MSEIPIENERYMKYFRYKGETYTEKTVVKFAQSFLDTHTHNGLPIWEYAWFSNKVIINGTPYYVFWKCNVDPYGKWMNYSGSCRIKEEELDTAIEEIIKARPIIIRPMIKQKDWEVADVMIGWAIYIVVLFFSLVFTEWYIAWFWASIFFFMWRKAMLLK